MRVTTCAECVLSSYRTRLRRVTIIIDMVLYPSKLEHLLRYDFVMLVIASYAHIVIKLLRCQSYTSVTNAVCPSCSDRRIASSTHLPPRMSGTHAAIRNPPLAIYEMILCLCLHQACSCQ